MYTFLYCLRWGLGVIFLALSIYFLIADWYIFVHNYILKKQWTSLITFACPFFSIIGLVLCPISIKGWFYLLPFIIDWGSFPIVIISIIKSVSRRNRIL